MDCIKHGDADIVKNAAAKRSIRTDFLLKISLYRKKGKETAGKIKMVFPVNFRKGLFRKRSRKLQKLSHK